MTIRAEGNNIIDGIGSAMSKPDNMMRFQIWRPICILEGGGLSTQLTNAVSQFFGQFSYIRTAVRCLRLDNDFLGNFRLLGSLSN